MDFQQAEARFQQLDQQYRSQKINLEVYRAALQALRVTDGWGRVWQMQEGNGQWHVLDQGRWVAAVPPRGAAGAAPLQAGQPAGGHSERRSRRLPGWLAPVGVAVGLASLGVMAFGVTVLLRGGIDLRAVLDQPGELRSPAAAGASQDSAPAGARLEFRDQEVITVSPGSGPQTDAHGVTLFVPPGAAGEGQQAVLTAAAPDSRLEQAPGGGPAFETPFYSLAAQGGLDGMGRAELAFPASSPNSRLVAVIDGVYLAVLDVQSEGGVLRLNPRLSAQGEAVPGMGSSVHYAVLAPDDAGANFPGGEAARRHLAAPSRQANRDCTTPAFEGVVVTVCRKDPSGSVYLQYGVDIGLSADQADRVVDVVAAGMKRYAELGFAAARISPSNYVNVVVFQGAGDPQYSFRNGVVYLPLDLAQSMGSGPRYDVYHELAHWIQDEEYVMLFAGASGAGRWWMETSAENMVMLLDSAYTSENLSHYGGLTGVEPQLVLQSAPYQWPGDFYAHAQLVKVNMCDGADCPISQASFVKAINEGTYPFDDAGAQAKVNANLDDYARYLLGLTPLKANSAIPLTGAVASGRGFGEEINISETTRGQFQLTYDGTEPQMRQETMRGTQTLAVRAQIEKDGVYVLHVTSGNGGKYAGLPAALRIGPGAAFWYRVDGGDPQRHDGSTELLIQPIHNAMGIKDVRIVALGRQGGETFNARVEVVSLEGVWLFELGDMLNSSVACSDNIETTSDPSPFAFLLVNMGSAVGDYHPDPLGPGMTWELVPGRLPPDEGVGGFNYTGGAELGTQGVTVEAMLELPSGQEARVPPAPSAAGLTAILPVAAAIVLHRRAPRASLLLLGSVLLTGCIIIGIYGTSSGEFAFSKLEYLGGEDVPMVSVDSTTMGLGGFSASKPVWRLGGGQVSLDLNLVIEVEFADPSGEVTEETGTCSGTAEYELTGYVFKDIDLALNDD